MNNAGIQHVAPLERFEPERFAFILRLMLEAPFLPTRAVLPASAYKSAYVSGKHGLLGLSKVIALEGAATAHPKRPRSPVIGNGVAAKRPSGSTAALIRRRRGRLSP